MRPFFSIGLLEKPERRAFVFLLSPIWLRTASRHSNSLSFNGPEQILTFRTHTPDATSSTRLTFSGWPVRPKGLREVYFVSGIDRRVIFARREGSIHARLAAHGLFPKLPKSSRVPNPEIVGLKTETLGRSNFSPRYLAALSAAGPISASAAAARRRFLNWAVGRKEASVLDGWIDKGIAPMRPAAQAAKGDAK